MINFYWWQLFSIFGGAILIGVFFTWLVKLLANKYQHYDWPDQTRKLHTLPMPLAGGLALYLGLGLLLVILRYFWLIDLGNIFRIILSSGLVLVIGGLLDEKFNLKPWQQILFPIAAIIMAIIQGLNIHFITNPFGGILQINNYWLSAILVFIWLLGMIYTSKILDGQDGLASGVGVIGAIIIFFISWSWDKPASAVYFISLAFSGLLIGFLFWNFYPAKIYLGESGSTLIGFILGVLALATGAKIAATVLVMALPILDLLSVIIQRIRQGVSPFKTADRKHLHYRLQDAGMSVRQTVLVLFLITLMFSFGAVAFRTTGKIISFLLVAIVVFIILPIILKRHVQNKAS